VTGALLLLASCTIVGASPSPPSVTPQPVQPTISPPRPTTTAEPSPTGTAAPNATDHEQQAPPLGELRLPDGAVVPGLQGSWCYDRGCLDAIPPERVDLPRIDTQSDVLLTFTLAETHPFAYWRVDYAPEQDDESTIRLDEGGTYVDPDVSPATSAPEWTTFTFQPPPAGDWVLTVHLSFPGVLGGTVYYWHAVVD